ncbi:MAG: thioredoxin domain-containing protein, partial [Deltaproteobacteria bacterium]|nr:thioredoxin domain-containing protein [Deltaproteobacteria bacterium]
KTIIIGAIIVVLAGVLLFYFFYLQNPGWQVLAQVNGEKITVGEFNRELKKVESPLKEMLRENPQQLLEGIIMNRVFLQEAKKQGLTPPIKTYKDTDKDALSPEEALIGELMKKKFSTPPTVTKEEIKTFYPLLKDRLGGKPLDQVSPIIEQFIRELKQQEEMKQYVTELRASAKVETDQIHLQKIASKPPESNTEDELKKAFAGGKPFLVDFGANSCLPCRQLRPILKEIGKEYAGKAQILVIDVYKYQHLAKEYKIQALPTLVFFDNKGKEVFRHPGAMNKDQIVAKLKEIGAGS